jgi:transcriptional regulator with XRE-family HTH domain
MYTRLRRDHAGNTRTGAASALFTEVAAAANLLAAKALDAILNKSRQTVYYYEIFFTNILRLLGERGMTKQQLADKAGVSVSFLSDITNGHGNPSIKVMEAIADALDTPLPLMLEATDLSQEALDELANGRMKRTLPKGYERISAVLPEHQAFIVKKWDESARSKLRRKP